MDGGFLNDLFGAFLFLIGFVIALGLVIVGLIGWIIFA
jgi:hypothetical protein